MGVPVSAGGTRVGVEGGSCVHATRASMTTTAPVSNTATKPGAVSTRSITTLTWVARTGDPTNRELPMSGCLDPSNAPSSTRAILESLTNAVNHQIKLTRPSVAVVNWRSMGGRGRFHNVCIPFQLQARTSPLATLITSETPKMFATEGTKQGAEKPLSTIPLAPFVARKGEEIVSEGHPQTPGKGASPLCTPLFHQPARTELVDTLQRVSEQLLRHRSRGESTRSPECGLAARRAHLPCLTSDT